MTQHTKITAGATELQIPGTSELEISRGDLTLKLCFNGQGTFSLTHNGTAIAQQMTVPKLSANPSTVMRDGAVYAGVSPDAGKAFYVAAQDAPEPMSWRRAHIYASQSNAHGLDDWRLPTAAELDVMFNNRAAIGNFDESGSFPFGWYWSSSEVDSNGAWSQRFSDGAQYKDGKNLGLAVRCVRG